MANRVFISYRRTDVSAMADRLRDSLVHSFAYDCLMSDDCAAREAGGPGYPAEREDEIAACAGFLAVIGARWLMRYDERGRPGLFHREDVIRRDIAAALSRDVPILVVLAEAVAMPEAARLPADILLLAYQPAVVLRSASFANDVAVLVERLRRLAPAEP